MVNFNYKGLICPVFTPFTHDKKTIDYDIIDKYCHFLKTKGVCCVLVNSEVGEMTCLRVEERMKLADEWLKCCRKHGLVMVLCIGGCDIVDTYELCAHAEKIAVDCICLVPDLFYRPRTEEDVCEYFKDVTKYCPNRPIWYYHHPRRTCIKLCMTRLYELLEKCCGTFCGFYYRCTDIECAVDLLRDGRRCIIACDTTLCCYLTLGFDTFVCCTLNILPEMIKEIYDCMCNGKLHEARDCQWKLVRRCKEICVKDTCDWIECMKREFNKIHTNFAVGGLRKPLCTLYKRF